jgi:hypothetical protein
MTLLSRPIIQPVNELENLFFSSRLLCGHRVNGTLDFTWSNLIHFEGGQVFYMVVPSGLIISPSLFVELGVFEVFLPDVTQ